MAFCGKTARRGGRFGGLPIFGLTLAGLIGGAGMATSALSAPVLPTGGSVQAGSASISGSASGLTINQTSSRAIINWSSFSIGQGGAVQFNNGDGATLNRVTGATASQIDGLLSGTGSVYVVNPNGVVVGKSGVVRVGGTFAASTLDVANGQFMGGGDLTFTGDSNAAVVNYGKIGALGGDVALIAAKVTNQGEIDAANGDAGLVAGYQVTLRDASLDDGKFAVVLGGPNTSVTNGGLVQAADAELRANGGSVYALAGNTSSVIKATGVAQGGGKVFLVAENGGATVAQGEIDATKADGSGGDVETSGGTVDFTGLSVKAGNWLVDPYDLTIDAAAASVIASNLATTNVTLQTTWEGVSGPGIAAGGSVGDINVTSAISWSSANTLTLDAFHSINIDAPITASGAGKVVLKTNDGGSGGDFGFGLSPTGFAGSLSFTGTPGSGQALTINGQAYTLLYKLTDSTTATGNSVDTGVDDIAGIDHAGDGGFYALATNLVGTADSFAVAGTVNASDAQFNGPLVANMFTGVFTGLGHTLSGLTIASNKTSNVGLFAGSSGTIRDVGLLNDNVSASQSNSIGALAGFNSGLISNSYATGVVTDLNGFAYVGGLIGRNASSIGTARITNDFTTGTVAGGEGAFVGGLVGENEADGAFATIAYSSSAATVTGEYNAYVGGLVGINETSTYGGSATIAADYASGVVTGGHEGTSFLAATAGGLVGINASSAGDATITGDYSTAAVSTGSGAGAVAGGLVGMNRSYGGSAVVNINYELGSVSGGANAVVGGLVGMNMTPSTGLALVVASYATGLVSGGSGATTGGVIGQQSSQGGTLTVYSDYWDTQTTGQTHDGAQASASSAPGAINGYDTSTGSVGLTTAQFFNASNMPGFAFTSNTSLSTGWVIVDSDGSLNNTGGVGATRPMLDVEYSTTINNVHQLQLMAMNPGANYVLGTNIDASATADANASGLWGAAGFSPIGSIYDYFTGTFDGRGHTIDSLTINAPSATNVGLFGAIYAATIENVGLTAVNIKAEQTIGALVGFETGNATVYSSYSSGSVSGSGSVIGGLLGQAAGIVDMVYSSAAVSGANNLGGLSGNLQGGLIENAYATGAVTGGLNSQVDGGLVGLNAGTVTGSYATGAVAGAYDVGGLVGSNAGQLTDVYAAGAATARVQTVGGLVGYNASNGAITRAYAIGAVHGSQGVGGLIGQNDGTASQVYATGATNFITTGTQIGGLVGVGSGTVNAGYWDTQTTGQSASAQGAGRTTAQFYDTSNLAGFTFGTTPDGAGWVIVDGDGTLNNASGAAGGVRPMLLSEYTTTIINAHQMQLIALDPSAGYTLAADIDLSGANGQLTPANLWATGGFVPLGQGSVGFTGTFDGQGHTLSGLTIHTPTLSNVGLFGVLGQNGLVENTILSNAAVTGATAVGALVGLENSGATVTASTASGSVTGASWVGGLVGLNYGSVTGATATDTANGTTGVGGLVGYNAGSVTSGSTSIGLAAGGTWTGGLVGVNIGIVGASSSTEGASGTLGTGGLIGYNSGAVTASSASIGAVSGTTDTGGLVGFNDIGGNIALGSTTTGANVSGSTWTGGLVGLNSGAISQSNGGDSVTGVTGVGGLAGYNNGAISNAGASSASVAGGAGSDVGGLVGLNDTGGTISGSTTEVGNVSGGSWVGGLVGLNYGTVSNQSQAIASVSGVIGVGGLVGYNAGLITGNSSSGGGVVVIHAAAMVSSGVAADASAGGIEAYSSGNVAVSVVGTNGSPFGNDPVTGTTWVGGLVGVNIGTINGGSSSMNKPTGTTGVGGLAGYNSGVINTASASAGNVSGATFAGGLVGFNDVGGNITAGSASQATVTGDTWVGGLVGLNYGKIGAGSSATDTVDGTTLGIGGLAGYNSGSITSASVGPAIVSAPAMDVGGLVGFNDTKGVITGSTTTSTTVAGATWVGGLVGLNSGTVTGSSASLPAVSGTTGVGGLVGYNIGVVTSGSMGAGGGLIIGVTDTGGLVGLNDGSGTITSSTTSGDTVSGTTWTGGLVGLNNGSVSGSSSADAASGSSGVGGLVGYNAGSVTSSTASAASGASGATWVGGLVGVNVGSVTTSSAGDAATGVAGARGVGGLAGYNSGAISRSFATGAVNATGSGVGGITDEGGLVGLNDTHGTITDTYATGAVGLVGTAVNIGGLAGYNQGSIKTSWSSGHVVAVASAGGLVGDNAAGGVLGNDYWDQGLSGRSSAYGVANAGSATNVTAIGGSTGRSVHAQLTYAGFNFSSVWAINAGTSRPYLRNVSPQTPPP